MDESISANTGAFQAPSIDQERERLLTPIKDFRKAVDALIHKFPLKASDQTGSLKSHIYNPEYQAAYEQARTHLIEAKMWGGKLLEALGNPFPPELADKAE